MKLGLRPVVYPRSRVLVLGTLPGDESLRLGQYYSHPGNHFWSILGAVYSKKVGPSYEERCQFLKRHRLALWDVLRHATRHGSLDAAIRDPMPNSFVRFFQRNSGVRVIVFNGKRPQTMFHRLVLPKLPPKIKDRLTLIEYMPSTSPTPGKYVLALKQKVKRWKKLASL